MSKKDFPLEPLGDQVIIQQDSAESKTSGGIIIPEQAKERPKQGKVLAVGPGKRMENGELLPVQLTVGDRIIFSPYAGNEVKVGETTYLILTEGEILARVLGDV